MCVALSCIVLAGPEACSSDHHSGLSGGKVAMVKHIPQKSTLALRGAGGALNVKQEEEALVTESLRQYDGGCQWAERLVWEQVVPTWPTEESAVVDVRAVGR